MEVAQNRFLVDSSRAIILGVAESKDGSSSALVDGFCSPSNGHWNSFRIRRYARMDSASALGIGHGSSREQRVVADAFQRREELGIKGTFHGEPHFPF